MDLDPPPHPPRPPPPPPPWGAVNGGGYDESSFPLPRKHSVQDGWKNLEKSLRVYVYSGQWKRIRFSITEITVCSVRWYQAMVINIYSPGKAKASCATSAVLFVLLLAAWMFHDNWRVETLWTIKSVSGWCTIENCQHWFCVVHQ